MTGWPVRVSTSPSSSAWMSQITGCSCTSDAYGHARSVISSPTGLRTASKPKSVSTLRRLVDGRLDGVDGADVRAGLGPGGRCQSGDVRGAGPVELGVQGAGKLTDRRRRRARVQPVRTAPGGPLVRDPGDPPRGQQGIEVPADRVRVQAHGLGDLLDPDDVVGGLDEVEDGRPGVATGRGGAGSRAAHGADPRQGPPDRVQGDRCRAHGACLPHKHGYGNKHGVNV